MSYAGHGSAGYYESHSSISQSRQDSRRVLLAEPRSSNNRPEPSYEDVSRVSVTETHYGRPDSAHRQSQEKYHHHEYDYGRATATSRELSRPGADSYGYAETARGKIREQSSHAAWPTTTEATPGSTWPRGERADGRGSYETYHQSSAHGVALSSTAAPPSREASQPSAYPYPSQSSGRYSQAAEIGNSATRTEAPVAADWSVTRAASNVLDYRHETPRVDERQSSREWPTANHSEPTPTHLPSTYRRPAGEAAVATQRHETRSQTNSHQFDYAHKRHELWEGTVAQQEIPVAVDAYRATGDGPRWSEAPSGRHVYEADVAHPSARPSQAPQSAPVKVTPTTSTGAYRPYSNHGVGEARQLTAENPGNGDHYSIGSTARSSAGPGHYGTSSAPSSSNGQKQPGHSTVVSAQVSAESHCGNPVAYDWSVSSVSPPAAGAVGSGGGQAYSPGMLDSSAVSTANDMVIEDDYTAEGVITDQQQQEQQPQSHDVPAIGSEKRRHDETEDAESRLQEQQRHAKAAFNVGKWCSVHTKERLSLFCSVCSEYICPVCLSDLHQTEDGKEHDTISLSDICEERKVRVNAQYRYLKQNVCDPLHNCKRQVQENLHSLNVYAQQAKRNIMEFVRSQAHRIETELVAQVDEVERARLDALYKQLGDLDERDRQLLPVVRFALGVLGDESAPDPKLVTHLAEAEERLCGVEFPSNSLEPCVPADIHYMPNELGFLEQRKAFGTLRTDMALGSLCVVQGMGLTEAFRHQRMTVILTAFDKQNTRIALGGDKLTCSWSDVPHDMSKAVPDPPEITTVDNHDGTYDISYRFTSQKCGLYTMCLKVNGTHVCGSPFRVNRGHWHLTSTSDPSAGVKFSDGHLRVTARSSHQFVIGNRGFLQGQHVWKVTFEGGRFAVGAVSFVDPKENEPWEDILRRSYSWCADGLTYKGPYQEPTSQAQSLDYAKEVFVHLDCSARTLTLARQLISETTPDAKVDRIEGLPPGTPLFPLFALRNGGAKLSLELL